MNRPDDSIAFAWDAAATETSLASSHLRKIMEHLNEVERERDRWRKEAGELADAVTTANRIRADETMRSTQLLAKLVGYEPYEASWNVYRERLEALDTEDSRDAVRHMDRIFSEILVESADK